jgi:glutaminyl-peptide cyclotransferase
MARIGQWAINSVIFLGLLLVVTSCNNQPTESVSVDAQPKSKKAMFNSAPDFNADTAYLFVKQQVDFGPRVPGSKAHQQCGEFIEKKLRDYSMEIITQRPTLTTYDGKQHRLYNIIGVYKPELQKRILLFAHWDTRHIADRDTKDKDKPILGADDGASGVGVLLEIARQIHLAQPELGIDFFFTDLEDYGQPDDYSSQRQENSWCLGAQYWAANPHVPGYKANYGILLDMVGAKNAVFPREGTSLYYAPDIVDKVWRTAQALGYGALFVNDRSGNTTDDHLYVNRIANIPSIDIVHMNPMSGSYGFYHHTHNDNMDIIDPTTLKAVGQTVLQVLFNELPPAN